MTMPIDQQIAELKAELNNACLTPRERREAQHELEFLTEQDRSDAETAYFTKVEGWAAGQAVDLAALPF
ncbi:MAG: hypothetical protein GY873_11480 [Bosea sp.]|uniref:hypothetical protein n=1 Tax=Bosea sp. (in: a-proteobacteria) TaxID=1871050 RepID=UPI00239B4C96|nr:hypothetical protein [Bosea sp. (in: a-proteobacteria)]MCP4734805.1 hypothetical protein [Bosea sp. (in: a-proteobacteria)]